MVLDYRLSDARVAPAVLPGIDARPALYLHKPGQLLPLVSGPTFLFLDSLDFLDRQAGHHGGKHQTADFAMDGEEVSAELTEVHGSPRRGEAAAGRPQSATSLSIC
jgi:hypothetical protein